MDKNPEIGTIVNLQPWKDGKRMFDKRLGLVAEAFGDDKVIVWFYSMQGKIENGVTAQPFSASEIDQTNGTVLNVELRALRRAEIAMRDEHRFPELYGRVVYMLDARRGWGAR